MRKKWPVRALLVLLCMVMLCSIPSYAVEARADDRIMSSTATLSKAGNGDFSVYFSLRGNGEIDVIGASSVEMQRNTILVWVTEYTFMPSNAPEIQAENKYQHSAVITYSPLFTGKEYRAMVMIHVKDATGISTQQLTSRTVIS